MREGRRVWWGGECVMAWEITSVDELGMCTYGSRGLGVCDAAPDPGFSAVYDRVHFSPHLVLLACRWDGNEMSLSRSDP